MILIVDFGSQTCHLIGRRLKDLGIISEIILPQEASIAVKNRKVKGIILSGGPASVYEKNALLIDKSIFHLGIPVLGICYGLQLMAQMLGGKVTPGRKKEYGPTICHIKNDNPLFAGLPEKLKVWMSHFDTVVKPPRGCRVTGVTANVKVAAFAGEKRQFYGVQFHPEVQHTEHGSHILANFALNICNELPSQKSTTVKELVTVISSAVKDGRAVCALSGGIDSTVAALLSYKAIGKNLTCIYVDTGLMREGETEEIKKRYRDFPFDFQVVNAGKIFLKNLKGIVDPEEKRIIIGNTFIDVFQNYAAKIGARYLIQGTIYPDVIESKGTAHAHKIKSHHNVGGIPPDHGFIIVEPLRLLYKDEVRELAKDLKIPPRFISRHVFPGPGLAVRIIGEITPEKLNILKKADTIVVEEIKKAGVYDDIWMAFAVFTGIKTTGVGGDERKYGETIAIRVIESKDTMTADWVRLPYELLAKISERIVNEVFEVVRVVYDITTKPPATMEWE